MGALENFVHLFAPLTANCRDFRAKWEESKGLSPQGVSGCWTGEWISAATGHHGRLLCVVSPLSDASWRMYFRAEYAGVFRACYCTDVSVEKTEDGWTFSGVSDLGLLAGGEYTYSGRATPELLMCSYKSSKDHGEFKLRPQTKDSRDQVS